MPLYKFPFTEKFEKQEFNLIALNVFINLLQNLFLFQIQNDVLQ